jgi:phosphoglycerate kinase
MNKRTIRDVDVSGKRVLVRVDFNVPLDENKHIVDDTRLRAAIPTILYLIEHGARVILMSHLGRPDGKIDPKYSLEPVAKHLWELMGRPVSFVADTIGPEALAASNRLTPGDIVMLENLRFHPGEEKNDPSFALDLAKLADLYVNDAFGTAHRAHASTAGVAEHLPAVAGLLMERELDALGNILRSPRRPFVAIIGGSKISSKIGVLENLIPRVDHLLVGGAMAFTFLAARGCKVGRSLVELDRVDLARDLMRQSGDRIGLPIDAVCAQKIEAGAPTQETDACNIPEDWIGLDVGPKTTARWSEILRGAATIVWNGPLGYYEIPEYAAGTQAVLDGVVQSGATSIVGGGDLVAVVEQSGYADRISHVSTGGGASLEFLEGKVLPGVAALDDQ